MAQGDGINTGTGGFPINTGTGPDKAYVLDTAADANDAPPAWNSGDIAVDNSIRDISRTTKRTLASYLSKTTLGQTPSAPSAAPNRYAVNNSSSQDPVDLKLQDAEGWSVPLTQIDPAVQPSFSPRFSTGRSNDSAALSLNRGRLNPTSGSPDGNSLLADAADPSSSPPLWPNTGVPNFTSLSQGSPTRSYYDRVISNNSFITRFDSADATQKYLDKLASYVNSGVPPMNKGNAYPVSVSTREITKLTDAEGYPATLTTLSGVSGNFFRALGTGRSLLSANLKILRGRQKPTSDTREDGNSLLPFSTDVLVGSQVPPPAGTVNVTTLSNTSPVKTYTEASISENEYSYSQPYSVPGQLRPENSIEATPVGEQVRTDIPSSKKNTLLDYLGRSTSTGGGKNAFPLDTTTGTEEKLRDVNGNPTSPHEIANENRFVPFNFLTSRGATIEIRRGKQTSEATVDGNSLLLDATEDRALRQFFGTINSVVDGRLPKIGISKLSPGPLRGYYENAVFVNRYDQDQNFTTSGNPVSKDSALFAKKYPMGQSLPPDDPSREISFGRLAQVGNALTRRASIELNSTSDGSPTGATTLAKDVLPGMAQLGIKKVNRNDLSAESVISNLTRDAIGPETLTDPLGESWGTLNNVNDEYSGISAFGMQLLAAAMAVGVTLIIGIFFGFFQWAGTISSASTPSSSDSLGRRPFGASVYDPSSTIDFGNPLSIISGASKLNFWRLFGISATRNPLSDCVATGGLSFFGIIEPDAGTASASFVAAARGAVTVTSSPGYYAIVARNITRSYQLISESIMSLGKAFSAGFVAGLKQLFGLLEVFKSSKFFKMINVFSQLGDRVIDGFKKNPDDTNQTPELNSDKETIGPGMRHKTLIDVAGLKSYGKSRITSFGSVNPKTLSMKHAWSLTTATDRLLSPVSGYFERPKTYSSDFNPFNLKHNFLSEVESSLGGTKGSSIVATNGRLSDDEREKFEEELDAEYVPFYFHDVRTNEIVSFHAFLASLSDDYSASYDTVESFGRGEPIKIYKSTTRKIAFSFYVAALHKEEFDSLWVKINKLTTMLYPQYNEGRELRVDNYKITVPFSQTIQSAPFTRIRIGDLVTSNYSRFNLARLFGFDNPRSEFGGKKIDSNPPNLEQDIKNKTNEKIAAARVAIGSKLALPQQFGDSARYVNNDSSPPLTDLTATSKFNFEVTGREGDNLKGRLKRLKSTDMTGAAYEGKDILVPLGIMTTLVEPSVESLSASARNELTPSSSTKIAEYWDEMVKFMSDEGADANAVAKSFRSSGGRGLGGHIDSMNFDWFDKVTWETDSGPGRKAPKMCKITVSFTPSHDISPGLDHNGINRAPIYNIRTASSNGRWRRQG